MQRLQKSFSLKLTLMQGFTEAPRRGLDSQTDCVSSRRLTPGEVLFPPPTGFETLQPDQTESSYLAESKEGSPLLTKMHPSFSVIY